MATALIPIVGRIFLFKEAWANTAGMKIGVFTTNYAGALADVLATYTAIEAAWAGYAEQFLPAPPTPAADPNNNAEGTLATFTFTLSATISPVTNYGWFIYDNATSTLVAACLFDTPQVVQNIGDQVVFSIDLFSGALQPPY